MTGGIISELEDQPGVEPSKVGLPLVDLDDMALDRLWRQVAPIVWARQWVVRRARESGRDVPAATVARTVAILARRRYYLTEPEQALVRRWLLSVAHEAQSAARAADRRPGPMYLAEPIWLRLRQLSQEASER